MYKLFMLFFLVVATMSLKGQSKGNRPECLSGTTSQWLDYIGEDGDGYSAYQNRIKERDRCRAKRQLTGGTGQGGMAAIGINPF